MALWSRLMRDELHAEQLFRGGAERIVDIELSAEEKAMLKTSAESVQKVVEIVKAKS